MNILFVKSRISEKENYRAAMVAVPLGFLYLIGMLERFRPGADRYKILDLRLSAKTNAESLEHLGDFSPDLIAMSAFSREAPEAADFLLEAKRKFPGVVTVLGGPYAKSLKELLMICKEMDFAIQGEAEHAFLDFLGFLEGDRQADEVGNLIYRINDIASENRILPLVEDIDEIPPPYWRALNLDAYSKSNNLFGIGPFAPLLTSRGCPYGCKYCCHTLGHKFRPHSIERVIGEMENLVRIKNVKAIEIIDEIFNFDAERAEKICDSIVERGLEISLSFPNGLRLDTMTTRLVEKLKNAGTIHIAAPFDSGSSSLQKRIGRRLDLEKAKSITRYIVRKDIYTVGYFMVGFPGETEDDFKATVDLASSLPFHFARLFTTVIFPDTEMAKEVAGIPDPNRSPESFDYFATTSINERIRDADIAKAERRIMLKFFHPARLRLIWRAYPSKKNLCIRVLKFLVNLLTTGRIRDPLMAGSNGDVSVELAAG